MPNIKIRTLLTLLFFSGIYFSAQGQILHSESFAVILDTSKVIKGNIVPDFKLQTQKEDLIEFENTTDITFRLNKNAITVANKIELSKYGDEVLLSGGFLYLEYRTVLENKFVLEPFSQIHWSEARGLSFKYAGGVNARYRIYLDDKIGFYAGAGPFYEYEKWNYDGVNDALIPDNAKDIVNEKLKLGSYLSFKWKTNTDVDVDVSLYHQNAFNTFVKSPRLASSTSIKYNFTEHVGLLFQYQTIYDYKPVVPIDKTYRQFVASIEVAF